MTASRESDLRPLAAGGEPDHPAARQVTFTGDLTCVHSYLGFTRFERVAERVRASGTPVAVDLRPFQVTPDAPLDGEPLADRHRRDFGAEAEELVAQMVQTGAREGLDFRFDRAVFVNTFPAHRLLAAAAGQGLGERMAERLFRAYFTDGLNIADAGVLVRLAADAGLGPEAVTGYDAVRLRADLARVRGLGIGTVPHMRYDTGAVLVGARPEEEYLQAFLPGAPSPS